VAAEVVGDEVPAAAERYEPQRFDVPVGALPGPRGVAELEPLGVPAGLGEGGEHGRVGAGRLATPGHRDGHGPQRVHAAPQPGWHHLYDLGERAHRRLGDPRHPAVGGGLQPDREGDGLLVVQHERREGGARGELVPAVDAAARLDGVAELAEAVDVAPQRPHRDAEPSGQLGPRPVPVGLQQRQQPQRPRARVRHVLQAALN
jgi:hypothetical protein